MENEIKVGEYVRTFNGKIFKIIDYKDEYFITDTPLFLYEDIEENNVIHIKDLKSFAKYYKINVIDLIEVRRLCKWRKSN